MPGADSALAVGDSEHASRGIRERAAGRGVMDDGRDGRDPGSAGMGLWAGGGGHLGGRGSFPEGKSQEILQELLQWACYRHSSLLGLPEPPRLACLISPDIVMIR